jgi:hypothetical protein
MIDLVDLCDVLADLGVRTGESYELHHVAGGRARVGTFARAEDGAGWVKDLEGGELWIKPLGQPRVVVAGFVGAGADAAARTWAEVLRVTGATATILGAGDERRELWLRHDLGAPETGLAPRVRRELIAGLAKAVPVAATLYLEPGRPTLVPGVLLEGGDVVEVLARGKGEAQLAALERLARDLDPRALPGPAPRSELEQLLGELPDEDDVPWVWVGSLAARLQHVPEVLAAAPEWKRSVLQDGVDLFLRKERVARGKLVDEARAKRIERAIAALGRLSARRRAP